MNNTKMLADALLAAIGRPSAKSQPKFQQSQQIRRKEDIAPDLLARIEREAILDERAKALARDRGRSALAKAFAKRR